MKEPKNYALDVVTPQRHILSHPGVVGAAARDGRPRCLHQAAAGIQEREPASTL
jgi:hypothetical protein